ncbi:hypothetical protein [Kordia jejudonensis]|uniref:hypothetical protein n=1 Tax=Kordia jejudonensis TaxID=1348245 RepID=UPI0006295D68|nr:hypothetical protein [Kordia jejudonensis]
MIVYGTGSKDIGTRKIQGAKCPNCESTEMCVNVTSNYAQVFWIPIFPMSKKFLSVCLHCDQVLEKKEMPQQLKDKIDMEKHHFKTPIYLFSGLAIIALLVVYAFYASGKHDEELAANVKNLEAKDVVVFKVSSKEYTFAEVNKKSNDTIYLNYSSYTYEGRKPSESKYKKEKATISDFYSYDDTYYFTQSEIDSLHQIEELVEIYKQND